LIAIYRSSDGRQAGGSLWLSGSAAKDAGDFRSSLSMLLSIV